MNRFRFGILMIVALCLVSACGGVPNHMSFNDDSAINVFNIKPEKGKAALVVAKTTMFGRWQQLDAYLDKIMIGVTNYKSYFVKTDVNPGAHYITIKWLSQKDTAKIKFEPKHVYYIQEIMTPVGIVAAPVSPEELRTSFDATCKLVLYDTNNPGDDMSDKDYKEAVSDYEREVREGSHKEYVGYKGVPAK